MEAASFYGSRKTTRLKKLREAYEAVQKAAQAVNVVVLPSASGDTGSQESDTEEADDDPEESYEPEGELEGEEEVQSDEIYDTQQPTKKKCKKTPRWRKQMSFDNPLPSDDKDITEKVIELEEKSVYEIWETIFTPDIMKHIAFQTHLYAKRDNNNPNFHVSEKQILNVLGILLLSGYHTLPEEHHYWSTQPDLGVPIVYNTMSKNKYLEIKRYIHFADNQNLCEGKKK